MERSAPKRVAEGGGVIGKDVPRIDKLCRVCGKIMWCTPRREVCSKCRREVERDGKTLRDKIAATLRGEKLASDQSAAL